MSRLPFLETAYAGRTLVSELVGRHRFYSEREEKSMLVVIVCLEKFSDFVNLHKCLCLKTP